MTEHLLTPSKISAFLECAHHLTLCHRPDARQLAGVGGAGSMAELLKAKGTVHEAACLAAYRAQGKSVFEVPGKRGGELFASWVARIGNPMADGHDVIYQMPFVHDGIRGVADFLVRVDAEGGDVRYEPVDAKLARQAAKPGHVLQLCFYAEAIQALTGVAPVDLHIWLGSGIVDSVRLDDVGAYWRRIRRQLADVMSVDPAEADTKPDVCNHCQFCEFADACENEWRAEDSLLFVARILKADRAALVAAGVPTLESLAGSKETIEGVRAERLELLVAQASLQMQARDNKPPHPPTKHLPVAVDDVPVGFLALPAPDEGDVFLDYEGHPFWQADAGLFFLFGLLVRDSDGTWVYEQRWAHDRAQEGQITQQLIDDLTRRRALHPGMHVYHYNHTERSSLQRLAMEHGVGEVALDELVETGLFVDLLAVVSGAMQVGVESYGLKHIERLTDFERSHEIDKGAGAVIEYDAYCGDQDTTRLVKIARYNEDDVRATRALRDWLLAERSDDLPWRIAMVERPEGDAALDELVALLHGFGPDSDEHLLGDVRGYWRREWRAALASMIVSASQDEADRLDDPNVITGLVEVGVETCYTPTGRVAKHPGMRLRFPEQRVHPKFDPRFAKDPKVVYPAGESLIGYAEIISLDPLAREIVLRWKDGNSELGLTPTAIVLDTWIPPRPKPSAFDAFAIDVANAEAVASARTALLHRELPLFTPGHGPVDGKFSDSLSEIIAWAPHLQHSCVAIQGPPGTGKTYTGAHIIHALVRAGQRVGVTAMSHAAIDNLLQQTADVFGEAGDSDFFRVVRRGAEPRNGPLTGVTYTAKNEEAAFGDYSIVAGTTWLFAGGDMESAPVDVLLIDEAGQLSLADALAAARSAGNLILLGDPLQLAQVAQASHPGSSGASVLEHILGDDKTMPSNRGVFLTETRRMHPDVCEFISKQIYGGRLTSHASCAVQDTGAGTGLRWLIADHQDCSTESEAEVAVVVNEIANLVGERWIDAAGLPGVLTVADFMVVAPYNDQVDLLRRELDANPATAGVRAGTVDKFQGQEAPVVFFTMTASTAADIPRGIDFLFSKNRLNVAISRARALAYLVCTEDLLNSRAKTVEEMELISTLCAFVEYCEDE